MEGNVKRINSLQWYEIITNPEVMVLSPNSNPNFAYYDRIDDGSGPMTVRILGAEFELNDDAPNTAMTPEKEVEVGEIIADLVNRR